MKLFNSIIIFSAIILSSFTASAAKYKCMIQMKNYIGEGAYIIASVVSKDGKYVKTLYVLGKDQKWYHDLTSWHDKAYVKNKSIVNGITGASVAGGDRANIVVDIDDAYIDKGYFLRFESAVEDQPYKEKDLEFALTKENLAGKNEGSGYIRLVRFISQ